jgi:hypothetical protein
MNRSAKGNRNEHRTIKFLAKYNWISVRAAASKGMCELDVLAYHAETGDIKHIQSKSNHNYSMEDVNKIRFYMQYISAPNVSFEIWDWYDSNKYPIVVTILKDGGLRIEFIDPKLRTLYRSLDPEVFIRQQEVKYE